MTNRRYEPESVLERVARAMHDLPVPDGPDDEFQQRLVDRLTSSGQAPLSSELRPQHRRFPMRRVFSIAASLLVVAAVVGWLALLDRSGSRAFAQMIEKVKAARSVRLTTITRFGRDPEIKGRMYLEGDRLRFEQFDNMLVQVANLNQKQALFLDTHRKVAQLMEIDESLAKKFANPIDQLQHAKSDDAERIGEEYLQGRRTQVYRLRKVDLLGIKGKAEILVWVDAESELPAKIVIHNPNPKAETEVQFEDFVWNEPLDAQLFSLSVPDGFQAGVVATMPRFKAPDAVTPESAPAFVEGILHDRVPAYIVWDPNGTAITALMRDPESVPPLERRLNELRQWDVTTGKLRWSEMVEGASSLALSPDGKTLATAIGYELQLRDSASGKVTRKWATDALLPPVAFSPDGKTLAAGIKGWGKRGENEYGGVQIWDVEQGALIRTIADDKPTTFVGYSRDGKYVVGASNDGPVKLWDPTTGELARVFPGRRPAFSPDGETIAFPSAASPADKTIGKVDLYNLHDGSLVRSFTSEKGPSASWLLCVTFSPDGRLLAATDWNGTVTLWNAATGQRVWTITDHEEGVLSAAFAPDGATLATGSEDKTLRLWKLPADLIP